MNGIRPIAQIKPAGNLTLIDPEVSNAINNSKDTFNAKLITELTDIIYCDHGTFKVFQYPNPYTNPNDLHYLIVFHNKHTKKTFRIHGTIARKFLDLYRNRKTTNFPFADDKVSLSNTSHAISILSEGTLDWEASTNNVKLRDYFNADILKDNEDKLITSERNLIAYTEEYPFPDNSIIFENWKKQIGNVADKANWRKSRAIRTAGKPNQILLHETAGQGNLSFGGIQKDGDTFYIPHFVINDLDQSNKGNILQFADIAEQVFHGEILNNQSVGIEFVNAPIEAYQTKLENGEKVPDYTKPIFNLDKSEKGIYLKTKLGGLSKLFIPLEFEIEKTEKNFELNIPKDKLVNYGTLKAGIGKSKIKILEEDGDKIIIKYAKSEKFEHLASIVKFLIDKNLMEGGIELKEEKYWHFVARKNGELVYLFQHGYSKKEYAKDANRNPLYETHFGIDIRTPGLFTHLLIGGHADGSLQALYLFLRFAKNLKPNETLQLMINCLTSEKKQVEKDGLILKSKVVARQHILIDPETIIDIKLNDILKID